MGRWNMRLSYPYIGFICILICYPALVLGAGFTVYDFGAEEQAQGSAVAAQVNTPSAVFYNPAALTGLEGLQVKAGTSVLFPDVTFQSNVTNEETETDPGTLYAPYFFLSYNLNRSVALGVGIFSSNVNKVDYPNDWEGRFLVTSAELVQLNFAPTIAYKVTEQVSVGISAVLTRSSFEQSNQIDLSALAIPQEGSADLDGDGFGVGLAVGLKADILPRMSAGVVYKSPMKITMDGDARFSVPAPATPLFPSGDVETTLKFPQMLVVGIAGRPMPGLVLELDAQWTNWHVLNTQTIEFDNTTPAVQDTVVRHDWRNTWTIRLGGHYDIGEFVSVRAGYTFDPSAVPDGTISPVFPEPDKHIVTLGAGIERARWKADLYYAAIIGEDRDVDNFLPGFPQHDGSYESLIHVAGLSVGYRF